MGIPPILNFFLIYSIFEIVSSPPKYETYIYTQSDGIWFKTNKWYICIIFKQILADFFTFIIESLRDPVSGYPRLPSHYFPADCEAIEKATLKSENTWNTEWKYL